MDHTKETQLAPNVERESSARNRLLALEIRASRFGYAAFEWSGELVDWGNSWFLAQCGPLNATVLNRISGLIQRHRPHTVVVRSRKYFGTQTNQRVKTAMRLIRNEAKGQQIKFASLTTYQIRNALDSQADKSKYETAARIAKRYPELKWQLPRKRKSYESEVPRMAVFGAIAVGMAQLVRERKE